MNTIFVIIGSVREGRFGDKPAQWIAQEAKKLPETNVEIIDLKEWNFPNFSSPGHPSAVQDGNYGNELSNRFAKKIAEGDAFIIVTPEYNHGYSGALKNALDAVYKEWNNKPVAFVGYGSVMGGRVIEQLREVAVELQMAPIRAAVHVPSDIYAAVSKAQSSDPALFAPITERAQTMLNQLNWWLRALKDARMQPPDKS